MELLLPEWADGACDEAALANAPQRAQRLREGWQSLLAAVFGPLDLVSAQTKLPTGGMPGHPSSTKEQCHERHQRL